MARELHACSLIYMIFCNDSYFQDPFPGEHIRF